jgi:tRNA (guanine10-N2)-dimethyltransferase
MRYFFELSKEYSDMPKAEALACLKAEEIDYNVVESNKDLLLIEIQDEKNVFNKLASRLSMSYHVNELLFYCEPSLTEIKKNAFDKYVNAKGSIAIKYRNRSKNVDSQKIVRVLAGIYAQGRKVVLDDPDVEIRALIADKKVYVGVKKSVVDRTQFEKRKIQNRPFFSPITLHPRLARALVNLSAVGKNQVLLDPFCGTGGILLEAGLIDIKVIGSDIEDKMIKGSKETLDFYGVKNYDLFCTDVGELNKLVNKVDAVVTDLPYGKATTTKGEEISQLYKRAFENIYKVLNKEGRAVVGLSNKDMISLGEKYFSVLEVHKCRVHRSLTRYFVVYEK